MKKIYKQPTIRLIELGQDICDGGIVASGDIYSDQVLQNRVFIDLDDEDDNYDYATGKWF